MKLKNPTMTGFVLILSAFMCSADSMTLQPIIDLLATKVFPSYGYATVSMIMTVSALALAVISIFTGALTKIGKKKLLLLGSALFTIGGCAGVLITNIYYIIATRLIEGLGAGLVLTISMMLIPGLFEDQAKVDKLMGMNGVMTSIFAMLIGFTSGYLALVNWKLPFAYYLLGIVIFLLQVKYIPADEKQNTGEAMPASHISSAGIMHAVDTFIYGTITTFFFVCISGVVTELGIGNSAAAGTVTTFDTIGSMLIGFTFARIFGKLKGYTPAVLYFLMAIGSFLMLNSTTLVFACVAAFIFGTGYNSYFSYFLAKVSIISDDSSLDANMSLCNGIYYLGMFVASFAVQAVGSIFHNSSIVFAFRFMLICLIILGIFHLIIAISKKGEVVKN